MATGKSFLKTVTQFNKVLLARRLFQLNQPKIPLLTNQINMATSSASEQEASKKDYSEIEKTLLEKEKELEIKTKEAADFKDKYVRSLAESENIRKRGVKLVSDAKQYAIQGLVKDLLEVADILEKATKSTPEEERRKNEHFSMLYDGVVMTEVELQKVFKKHGIEKIDPVDEVFDPHFHEALFQIPFPDKRSGTVAVVEKIGYKLYGRALRAAQVGVVQ